MKKILTFHQSNMVFPPWKLLAGFSWKQDEPLQDLSKIFSKKQLQSFVVKRAIFLNLIKKSSNRTMKKEEFWNLFSESEIFVHASLKGEKGVSDWGEVLSVKLIPKIVTILYLKINAFICFFKQNNSIYSYRKITVFETFHRRLGRSARRSNHRSSLDSQSGSHRAIRCQSRGVLGSHQNRIHFGQSFLSTPQ